VEVETKSIKKTQPPGTASMTGDQTPVILVAEDVALNRFLAITLLKQMISNVIVYEAKNGKEAFEMAVSLHPDLIFMDVQMPEMSGIEATVEIRKQEPDSVARVSIVALTAGAVKGEKENCLQSGMDDFLTKPIDREALHAILKKHLTSFFKPS
jgi:CheY-like chemotaxis protein